MNKVQKEKLEDYLSGLEDLKNLPFSYLGAIIADKKDKEEILEFIKNKKTLDKKILILEEEEYNNLKPSFKKNITSVCRLISL